MKYYNRFMDGMMYSLFALFTVLAVCAFITSHSVIFGACLIAAGISFTLAGGTK